MLCSLLEMKCCLDLETEVTETSLFVCVTSECVRRLQMEQNKSADVADLFCFQNENCGRTPCIVIGHCVYIVFPLDCG